MNAEMISRRRLEQRVKKPIIRPRDFAIPREAQRKGSSLSPEETKGGEADRNTLGELSDKPQPQKKTAEETSHVQPSNYHLEWALRRQRWLDVLP